MYAFLQVFFQKNPQYIGRAFFITGESYAGHYIPGREKPLFSTSSNTSFPAISVRILEGNQKNQGIKINLLGSAIGNG